MGTGFYKPGTNFATETVLTSLLATKTCLVGINPLVILVKHHETSNFVYKIQKQKFKRMNFHSGNSWSCLFSK